MGGPPASVEAAATPVTTSSDYALMDKSSISTTQPMTAVISRLRLDNDEPLDLDVEDEDQDETVVATHNPRAYSVGSRPPITGSNSSVSTTGSGSASSRHIKSRFIDIPGATTASGTSGTGTGSHSSSISPGAALLVGQSPSMAARLGSWIRHRTGSVPSKSAVSVRRRHRTQSEGEKDEI